MVNNKVIDKVLVQVLKGHKTPIVVEVTLEHKESGNGFTDLFYCNQGTLQSIDGHNTIDLSSPSCKFYVVCVNYPKNKDVMTHKIYYKLTQLEEGRKVRFRLRDNLSKKMITAFIGDKYKDEIWLTDKNGKILYTMKHPKDYGYKLECLTIYPFYESRTEFVGRQKEVSDQFIKELCQLDSKLDLELLFEVGGKTYYTTGHMETNNFILDEPIDGNRGIPSLDSDYTNICVLDYRVMNEDYIPPTQEDEGYINVTKQDILDIKRITRGRIKLGDEHPWLDCRFYYTKGELEAQFDEPYQGTLGVRWNSLYYIDDSKFQYQLDKPKPSEKYTFLDACQKLKPNEYLIFKDTILIIHDGLPYDEKYNHVHLSVDDMLSKEFQITKEVR